MSEICFRYRVFGLTIQSPRRFPYLWPEPDARRVVDVRIEFSNWAEPDTRPSLCLDMISLYGTDCAVFRVASDQRIICLGGNRIIVDLSASLSDAELHTFICGRPIGWLLHQRGLTPLHAAVVRVGDVAVAIAGHSGAGKSTLARAMVGRGNRVVSDDLAVIDPHSLSVAPGFPSLKLWETAATANGDDVRIAVAVKPGTSKFHIAMPHAFDPDPAPLGIVVAIGRDPARSDFKLQRLNQRQAEAMLQFHVFNTSLARLTGTAATGFRWSLAIAAKVPVLALDRPDRLQDLPLICARIEQMARSRNERA